MKAEKMKMISVYLPAFYLLNLFYRKDEESHSSPRRQGGGDGGIIITNEEDLGWNSCCS
jgi:hypothetical protein